VTVAAAAAAAAVFDGNKHFLQINNGHYEF
jgi:hypothetical protein